MISFKGYEEIIDKVYQFNQEHVFEYWDELNEDMKKSLISQLSEIDFKLMNMLFHEREKKLSSTNLKFEPAPYIPFPNTKKDIDIYNNAKQNGVRYIRQGKVAALLVAGGQGTRLGFDGPKGIYPIGPVSNKSLFQYHAEKILKYSRKYEVNIPWLIMTSSSNNIHTINYFEKNQFFGLNRENLTFFSQNMIPSLDIRGKLILNSKYTIFMNPDGHGGTLDALKSSGALTELIGKGIEQISYFQIDNPLVNIIDPAFIGFHIMNDSDVSSKAVMKTIPEEKVGVFVQFENSRIGIVEYSDLSQEKQNIRDDEGKLKFCMGSIAIHLFNISFIESITSGHRTSLPFHKANKKIEAYINGEKIEIDGLKFEKFIFDSLYLTNKNTIIETLRVDEFAPVKNKSGTDSPETAKKLISNIARKWILSKDINLPDKLKVIEISPLLAVEPDDLKKNISIPAEEEIYLD